MIVAMKHEKRRFVPEVDFITSPGFLGGDTSRADAGLVSGGMFRVVTDLAIMGFDEQSKEMKVLSLHEGVSNEQVQDNTGFDLAFDDTVQTTQAPAPEELAVVRELDPESLYTA